MIKTIIEAYIIIGPHHYCSSFFTRATVHDEPWSHLRLLSIGPDPVTFVSSS
jgi:hypothetical protein